MLINLSSQSDATLWTYAGYSVPHIASLSYSGVADHRHTLKHADQLGGTLTHCGLPERCNMWRDTSFMSHSLNDAAEHPDLAFHVTRWPCCCRTCHGCSCPQSAAMIQHGVRGSHRCHLLSLRIHSSICCGQRAAIWQPQDRAFESVLHTAAGAEVAAREAHHAFCVAKERSLLLIHPD